MPPYAATAAAWVARDIPARHDRTAFKPYRSRRSDQHLRQISYFGGVSCEAATVPEG
jgi:hypothetical protein